MENKNTTSQKEETAEQAAGKYVVEKMKDAEEHGDFTGAIAYAKGIGFIEGTRWLAAAIENKLLSDEEIDKSIIGGTDFRNGYKEGLKVMRDTILNQLKNK